MNKIQKYCHVLAGLGDDVTIDAVDEEFSDRHGKKIINISVTNNQHVRICSECGSPNCSIADSGHDSWVWHIPQGERTLCKVSFHRKRYRCRDCNATPMEPISWMFGNSHLSTPLYECIREDLCHYSTKKEIARINGVSVYYVDLVVKSLRPPIPSSLPEVICLDETHSEVGEKIPDGRRGAWIKYTTNFSDGTTGSLLDILPFKTKKRLVNYFTKNFSYNERRRVKFLCCDMGKQYLYLANECFPNATVCLDNYHVTNRLNEAVHAVRIKEQDYLLSMGDNAAYADLKHLNRRLITSVYNQPLYWHDKETEITKRLISRFEASPELRDVYAMLQYFHEIFHDISDYDLKCERLNLWISVFKNSTSSDIYAAVSSVEKHLEYIHNAWRNGLSNAVCEGNNNAIQTVKNLSFGIHKFEYFRTRMLLIIGRPGVSRSIEKKLKSKTAMGSFFFDVFPELDEYQLAYDWKHPHLANKNL